MECTRRTCYLVLCCRIWTSCAANLKSELGRDLISRCFATELKVVILAIEALASSWTVILRRLLIKVVVLPEKMVILVQPAWSRLNTSTFTNSYMWLETQLNCRPWWTFTVLVEVTWVSNLLWESRYEFWVVWVVYVALDTHRRVVSWSNICLIHCFLRAYIADSYAHCIAHRLWSSKLHVTRSGNDIVLCVRWNRRIQDVSKSILRNNLDMIEYLTARTSDAASLMHALSVALVKC